MQEQKIAMHDMTVDTLARILIVGVNGANLGRDLSLETLADHFMLKLRL